MSTDLERDIGAALRERADAITSAELRRPDAPAPRSRRTAFLAALATAAVIVALAVGVAIWLRPTHDMSPASGSGRQLVGSMWQLVHVTGPDGSVDIPRSVHAQLRFTAQRVRGDDGCNAIGGRYAADRRTVIVYGLGGTLRRCVGSTRTDPLRAAIDGIAALGEAGRSRYTIRADTLTIDAGRYVLTFAGATAPGGGRTR